jgi:tungstate transport system substrate-binding protein
MFEKKTGIKIKVLSRGTGAAIEIGKRGDVDLVFVHAKDLELEAVREGYFVDRHDVCYNDFILVGPRYDIANAKEGNNIVDSFKKIAISGATFVSRGDKSGTHIKELEIWKGANIDPKGKKWYLETGQGMEKTLRVSSEKNAYTLTDRGTWLAMRDKLDLSLVFWGDPILFNQYGIMAVNPNRHKHTNYQDARTFIEWIVSKEGQEIIASFRDKFGNQLFVPNAK